CVFIKDFTTVLKMPRQDRDKILGDLRDIYDGSFSKAFGTRGTVRYDSHFNLVAAVTNTIEDYYTVQSVLGQRFIMVRSSFPGDWLTDGERDVEQMRKELTTRVRAVCEGLPRNLVPSLSPEVNADIKRLAREVAVLRTHVDRNPQNVLT